MTHWRRSGDAPETHQRRTGDALKTNLERFLERICSAGFRPFLLLMDLFERQIIQNVAVMWKYLVRNIPKCVSKSFLVILSRIICLIWCPIPGDLCNKEFCGLGTNQLTSLTPIQIVSKYSKTILQDELWAQKEAQQKGTINSFINLRQKKVRHYLHINGTFFLLFS